MDVPQVIAFYMLWNLWLVFEKKDMLDLVRNYGYIFLMLSFTKTEIIGIFIFRNT